MLRVNNLAKRRSSEISIERASKILLPVYGDINLSKEKLMMFIKGGIFQLFARENSPIHPNSKFSQNTNIDRSWFADENKSSFSPTVLDELKNQRKQNIDQKAQWRSYVYRGGILLKRKELNDYLKPQAEQIIDAPFITKIEKHSTHWNLPQLLAWVATQSYNEMAQISCDDPWIKVAESKKVPEGYWSSATFTEEEMKRIIRTQKRKQKQAIGWLRHKTSIKFCECGSSKKVEKEAWEECTCVSDAIMEIQNAISQKKLYVFDEQNREQLDIKAGNISLDGFNLKVPNGAGSILFSKHDVIKCFPKSVNLGGRLNQYDWPSFIDAAKKKIWEVGGFAADWNHSKCVIEMTDWCDQNWLKTPSESMIKSKVTVANGIYLKEKNRL